MKRSVWFGIVVVLALALAGTGCSKKPAMGEIVPAPGTSVEPKAPAAPAVDRSAAGSAEGQLTPDLKLGDSFFEYDKYTLTPEARSILAADAEALMKKPETRILIEGHCDERGTTEYNLALGDKRANAVRDFLVNYGVDRNRIETISYGEERPFAQGTTEAAWAQNRRAHFVIRT